MISYEIVAPQHTLTVDNCRRINIGITLLASPVALCRKIACDLVKPFAASVLVNPMYYDRLSGVSREKKSCILWLFASVDALFLFLCTVLSEHVSNSKKIDFDFILKYEQNVIPISRIHTVYEKSNISFFYNIFLALLVTRSRSVPKISDFQSMSLFLV